MSELGIFAYCAAVGFVTAGTISSLYRWLTSNKADFSVTGGVPGVVLGVLLSMFAGPFIVVDKVLAGLRAQELQALPAICGVVVAGMWSVCAGIFYVSLLASA